MKASKISR